MAKIIKFNDNFNLLLKLVDERVAAGDYVAAISVLTDKLKGMKNDTMLKEILMHKLSELYIKAEVYEENVALFSEMATKFDNKEYLAILGIIYPAMQIAGRGFDRRDVEYLTWEQLLYDCKDSLSLFELFDKYSYPENEPFERISISERRDVREVLNAYKAYENDDPEHAIACLSTVPPESKFYEIATELTGYAAFACLDFTLAVEKALELCKINKNNTGCHELLLVSLKEDPNLESDEVHDALSDLFESYKQEGNGVMLAKFADNYLYAGRLEEGYEVAKAAYDLIKTYPKAISVYAVAAMLTGDIPNAEKAVMKGRSLFPRCSELILTDSVSKWDDDDGAKVLYDAFYGEGHYAADRIYEKISAVDLDNPTEKDKEKLAYLLNLAVHGEVLGYIEEWLVSKYEKVNEDFSEILVSAIINPYVGGYTKESAYRFILKAYPEKSVKAIIPLEDDIVEAEITAVKFGIEREREFAREIYAEVSSNLTFIYKTQKANAYVYKNLLEIWDKGIPTTDVALFKAYLHYLALKEKTGGQQIDLNGIALVYRVGVEEVREFIKKSEAD